MASFNRIILAGNLTRDPQLSYLPSQMAVVEFGMAVNHKRKDRDGNTKEEVCFVDVAAYGKQAEVINQYFQKGKPILVEGRLRFHEWTSKEGQKRSKLDVVIDSFSFIDSPSGGAGTTPQGAAPPHTTISRRSEPPPPAEDMPPVDDSIPF